MTVLGGLGEGTGKNWARWGMKLLDHLHAQPTRFLYILKNWMDWIPSDYFFFHCSKKEFSSSLAVDILDSATEPLKYENKGLIYGLFGGVIPCLEDLK